jgi:hypothetical protein
LITNNIYKHITDVGSSSWNWVDSQIRIAKQYYRLWVNPIIISAGNSPLHIAFTACTDLSPNAIKNTVILLEQIKLVTPLNLTVALNCAPRNATKSSSDWKENHIYRVKFENSDTFLIYWFELLLWVLELNNFGKNTVVEKILSIKDIILDTSSWSQFRSWEHLPIAHFLETNWLLDSNSKREILNTKDLPSVYDFWGNEVIIAPPDEYWNGRLIVQLKLFDKIMQKKEVVLEWIIENPLVIKKSLTEVVPDELSLWPSSNHFPNETLKVLNIWTRWKPKTTNTSNEEVIQLAKKLSSLVWKSYKINF